jgi:hypothetical protein
MYFKKSKNNHRENNKRGSTIVRGARCIIKKVGVASGNSHRGNNKRRVGTWNNHRRSNKQGVGTKDVKEQRREPSRGTTSEEQPCRGTTTWNSKTSKESHKG